MVLLELRRDSRVMTGNLGFLLLALKSNLPFRLRGGSCLENPMDGGAWWAADHGVAKSRTRLSDFTFTFHFYALEKEMAHAV